MLGEWDAAHQGGHMDSAMASRSGLPWVAISCSADRRWARGRHSIQDDGNRVFSLGHEQERDDATWKGGQVRNRREIPPLRRPTRSQEANAEEKSRSAPVGMTVRAALELWVAVCSVGMTVRREYSRRSGQVRDRREIPPLRRPTHSQEANAEDKVGLLRSE